MDSVLSFLNNYKIIDMCIVGVGLFGVYLTVDRFRTLFWHFALPAEPFLKQVMTLVEQDKIEEAITFCGANEKKPLAYVTKRILEKSDRDDHAVETAHDIAAAEVAPRLMKRLG